MSCVCDCLGFQHNFVKAEESEVQDHHRLCREFEASIGYMKPPQKTRWKEDGK